MAIGLGPPSQVVNSFQLNKGIALVGFESLLCCAAWDTHALFHLVEGWCEGSIAQACQASAIESPLALTLLHLAKGGAGAV